MLFFIGHICKLFSTTFSHHLPVCFSFAEIRGRNIERCIAVFRNSLSKSNFLSILFVFLFDLSITNRFLNTYSFHICAGKWSPSSPSSAHFPSLPLSVVSPPSQTFIFLPLSPEQKVLHYELPRYQCYYFSTPVLKFAGLMEANRCFVFVYD